MCTYQQSYSSCNMAEMKCVRTQTYLLNGSLIMNLFPKIRTYVSTTRIIFILCYDVRYEQDIGLRTYSLTVPVPVVFMFCHQQFYAPYSTGNIRTKCVLLLTVPRQCILEYRYRYRYRYRYSTVHSIQCTR